MRPLHSLISDEVTQKRERGCGRAQRLPENSVREAVRDGVRVYRRLWLCDAYAYPVIHTDAATGADCPRFAGHQPKSDA
jgi:hypothetical protein